MLIKLSPATKCMFLQSRSFCFLRTHARFQIAVTKFQVNLENSRRKNNSNLESCGKNNNIEVKEFSSGNTRVRHHPPRRIALNCVAGRLGTTILVTARMIEPLFVHLLTNYIETIHRCVSCVVFLFITPSPLIKTSIQEHDCNIETTARSEELGRVSICPSISI